jgi:hypothetical protein
MPSWNTWILELQVTDTLHDGDERLLEGYEIKQLISKQLQELQRSGINCRITDLHLLTTSPEASGSHDGSSFALESAPSGTHD